MATNRWIGGTSGNETTYTTAANWSLGSAPAGTNDVIIPKDAAYNITGSDQSSTALASFTIEDGCGITIGTGAVPLLIQATVCTLGNSGTVNIGGTIPTLTLKGSGATVIPTGATLTTVNVIAGSPQVLSAATTMTVSGGNVTWGYCGVSEIALGTVNVEGSGRCIYNSSGLLGIANVKNGGTLDGSGDLRTTTITTTNFYRGGIIKDPYLRFTYTNKIDLKDGATVTAS